MSVPKILLCGHGSRDPEAVREFESLARKLAARLPDRQVRHGFLEFARPTIGEALDHLRGAGARAIHAVPGMLLAAGHAKNDIPSVLNAFAADHPEIAIDYGRELAVEPKLLEAARARLLEAEAAATHALPRDQTLLLVVGRGTSDSDANSNIAKITRMLWEGMGYGWAEAAYSGVTEPRVDRALARIVGLGFPRIVVFPYFLFTGRLVKRIYEAVDQAARANPTLSIIKAPYLNDHPLVLGTLLERLDEISLGLNLMNCRLCKYRTRIIGYEDEQGQPQMGHHHHVEGIGTDADHDHAHDHHGHTHTHDHNAASKSGRRHG